MITFVVALNSEAEAIVEHFRLTRVLGRDPYRIVGNRDLRLVVSGVGKSASAAATAYCAGRYTSSFAGGWLNAGIAGHGGHPVGTALLASEIRDPATSKSWRTRPLFAPPCATTAVASFDVPNLAYPADTACDMEASGFFATAIRLSPVEFVHAVKVVSDAAPDDIQRITRGRIVELVEGALATIEALVEALASLTANAGANLRRPEVEAVLRRWPFTRGQGARLALLARRHALFAPPIPWPDEALSRCATAREVIDALHAYMDACAAVVDGPERAAAVKKS